MSIPTKLFPKYTNKNRTPLLQSNISAKKSIINLEYAKMVLNAHLQQMIGIYYTTIEFKFNQTELLVKIYLYNQSSNAQNVQIDLDQNNKLIRKDKITLLCKKILAAYCKFPVKVNLVWTKYDLVDHPKYYYRLLLKKCVGRTHPFNALSKLEKIKLHPKVKGLIIRVKGKRTNRKDKKVLLLGNPCRHSNTDNLAIRDYVIKNALGTLGVKILIAKANPLEIVKSPINPVDTK